MSEQKFAYHLGFRDVIRILRLVDETPFEELDVQLGEFRLHVVQAGKDRPAEPAAASAPKPAASAPVPEKVSASAAEIVDGTPVLAPLAGTFYRAPAPGATPFVELGAKVKEGDVIGILEIMKLMNHVGAPCAGVVKRICARNEEFVEFGQVLAVIEPGP